MSWSVNDIYEFEKFLVRKNQSGGISASDLFYAWNGEQTAYQSDLLGRWQGRSNGKSGIETGQIQNATITTKLAPFFTSVTIAVSGGQAPKPTDFIYPLALRSNGAKVFQINQDQIASVNADIIDPPSAATNTFYYTENSTYYGILPSTVASIDLEYIKKVRDIVWAWTLDADNRQVYDPVLSINPLWLQNDIIEITKRALKSFGVSFTSQDFEQFGNSIIQTGN